MSCSCGMTPLTDDVICPACVSDITKLLAETDGIVEDLVSAIPRASLTASYGERVSASGSLHAPLPINDTALDAHMALDKWLLIAAILVSKAHGSYHLPESTQRNSSGYSSYLLAHMNTLRRQDWAGKVKQDLEGLLKECVRATLPPGERINVGACGSIFEDETCTNPLLPLKDQDQIKCRVCGTIWDVRDRQRSAIGAAWDAIGPPAIVVRALKEYGITIKPKHIENWVMLGHLTPVNKEGRKQYRVADVYGVAKRMAARKKAA